METSHELTPEQSLTAEMSWILEGEPWKTFQHGEEVLITRSRTLDLADRQIILAQFCNPIDLGRWENSIKVRYTTGGGEIAAVWRRDGFGLESPEYLEDILKTIQKTIVGSDETS